MSKFLSLLLLSLMCLVFVARSEEDAGEDGVRFPTKGKEYVVLPTSDRVGSVANIRHGIKLVFLNRSRKVSRTRPVDI